MNNATEEMEEGRNKSNQDGMRREKTEHVCPIRQDTVAVICLRRIMGAGSGVCFIYRASISEPAPSLHYEANVVSGDIPGETKRERQQKLNSMMEEETLNMSMSIASAGQVNGSTNERSINWLIENLSDRGKLIRVEIARDDAGEKIYEIGAIRPGNYVKSAPLGVRLPAGEYAYVAVFFIYQENTEALIGQAATKIKLTLQE